jgi:predicted permease
MLTLLDAIRQNTTFAVRQLSKSPGLSLVAIAILALGIGTTTTIFSVVNGVVLRPLPFHEPERLVRVWELTPQGRLYTTSEPTLLDWQEMNRSFEALGGYDWQSVTLTGQGEPERLPALGASHQVLPLLGIAPTIGRGFLPEEDRPDAENRVVLLTQGFWERRFGGDPAIVGRSLTLNGIPAVVIGIVALPGFPFGDRDVVVPLAADPDASRSNHYITAVGRLAPGVSAEAAREDMAAIARQLGEAYPASNEAWGVELAPYDQWLVGRNIKRAVFVLLGAVGFLLLLACANVANLQLARGVARQREIAVRSALGAGRARLVGQLLTESLILALLGAGVGVLLTAWAIPLIQAVGPADLPRLDEVSIDGRVLLFTLAATLATAVIFGLTPALQASSTNPQQDLKEGARTLVGGSRLRDALVVGELALAVVLLVGAGLMYQSLLRMQSADLGYDPQNLVAIRLQLPSSYSVEERQAFFSTVEERIAGLPGVSGVGSTFLDPFEGGSTSNRVAAADWDPQTPEEFFPIQWRTVTSDFFATSGIPLHQGRTLDERDRTPPDGELGHVVVSRSLADRLWPDQNPIGRRLVWSRVGGIELEVVGVVGDVLDRRLAEQGDPTLYFHYHTVTWSTMTVIVRATIDPTGLSGTIRQAIREVAPDVPIPTVQPLVDLVASATRGQLFLSRLFAAFAALGLILATLGVYAVMMYQVSQRYPEIGVRMAMGARPRQIVGLVLRRSLGSALLGLAIGLASAFALSRSMTSMLFGTQPTDLATYSVVTLLLAVTAITVTLFPALRAARVDPLQTLAAE